MSLSKLLLIGACLGTLSVVTAANAQPRDSNVSFDGGGLLLKKPKPSGLPEVRAQPQAWPRLDPGAVLCRSEDDLDRLGARRRGESVAGPIDCQVIRAATAISIVQRISPGKTEVKTSDQSTDAVTGWTDAWLPDKGPIKATPVSR